MKTAEEWADGILQELNQDWVGPAYDFKAVLRSEIKQIQLDAMKEGMTKAAYLECRVGDCLDAASAASQAIGIGLLRQRIRTVRDCLNPPNSD